MAQDDELSLLLMEAGEIHIAPPPPQPPAAPESPPSLTTVPTAGSSQEQIQSALISPQATGIVHLVEEQVLAHTAYTEKDTRQWVLDTGATNHMSGTRPAFSEIDSNVRGTVKFGDGSVVQIEGVGTVLFSCKNGEHHAFTDVYYIPKLTTNIISLGQLEEAGY